jgi:hypothetical protein
MKETKMCSILPRTFAQAFLVWEMLVSFAPLHAQQINIRVLNGRNGKPVMNECLNIWTGTWQGAHLVASTNRDGVVVLHVKDNEILAESACSGWPARAARRPDADGITVSGDRYVACQEYGKLVPGEPSANPLKLMASYPIKRILEFGISSANTCGKFRVEAGPGELVFYVRPRSFFEKMRQ